MKRASLLLIVCLAAFVGCSNEPPVEDGVIVKANIIKGGQPLSADTAALPPGSEELDPFEFVLVPRDTTGSAEHIRGSYIGTYDATTGNLEFIGPGKGVPPGTYTLAINFVESMPGLGDDDDDDSGVSELDPLQGEFSEGNSPLIVDIPASDVGGEHDLGTIDLDDPPSE